jgi:hypothetical protein
VNAAAYVYIGHGPNASLHKVFCDIAMDFSASLQSLSLPKQPFDEGYEIAKEQDTKRSKRIFILQKDHIRRVSASLAGMWGHGSH